MSDELRETFFVECFELLEVMESGLLDISNEEVEDMDETIGAVFRAVHSIKGGAGAFALESLVRLAHWFETALDEARGHRMELTPDIMKVLLRASDALTDRVRADQEGDDPDLERETQCISDLAALVGKEDEAGDDADAGGEEAAALSGFQPMSIELDEPGDDAGADDAPAAAPTAIEEAAESGAYVIALEAAANLYRRGGDVAKLVRALTGIGDVEATCETAGVPAFDELDPETPCLSWNIRLETSADVEAIREVFEFFEDELEIEISGGPEGGAAEETMDIGLGFEPEPAAPAEPAAEAPAAAKEEPTAADEPAKAAPAADGAGDDAAAKPREPAGGAKGDAAKARAEKEAPKQTIRVDLSRIEQLINLVGELVINQAMLTQRMAETDTTQDQAIADGLDEFRILTRDIQESVMAIRAQPVKPLFQRMARIVREAAHATSKEVKLATSGEWTEVDKTIVERLADPLTHMIRNAVDHGLEKREDRIKAGKPEEGVVTLSAFHRSGRIIIEVADDGAGINRKKVREIAVDKGLLAADAQPTDAEIDNLLFAPGFSTAKEVSDLSGRGVGMDVVKKAIQALGGRTSIASRPGQGTSFSISLPLTLAVLDGIVVSIGDQTAVLPLSNVVETLRPESAEIKRVGGNARVVLVRGAPVPVIDVGAELGFHDKIDDLEGRVFIVVENHESDPHALVVDEIHDQRQVVIKGLDANYGEIRGVSAATILGDGRIALILDVDVLVDDARLAHSTPALGMTG